MPHLRLLRRHEEQSRLPPVPPSKDRTAISNSLWQFGLAACVALTLVCAVATVVVRNLTAALRHMVKELNQSAHEVASASAQVSSAGHALAAGTSQQAAS